MHKHWEYLFSYSSNRLHYLSYNWVYAFIKHLLPFDETFKCIFVFYNNNLIGLLPLKIHRNRYLGISYARTLCNPHSISGDILAMPGHEKNVVQAIHDALTFIDNTICVVTLIAVNEMSKTAINVPMALKKNQYKIVNGGFGSYLNLKSGYALIIENLSKNFKANLRKSKNKLLTFKETRYEYITGRKFSQKELVRFMDLEASGWKGETGTAIKMDKMIRNFYEEVFEKFSAEGIAECHFLSIGGQTIAAHLAVRLGRTLVLLKIAYDENYSHLAPGNMLFVDLLEKETKNIGANEINCITDMPWHNNWKMGKKNYYNIILYPNGIKSSIYSYYDRNIKPIIKYIIMGNK